MSLRLKFGRNLVSGSIGPPLSETASEHDHSGRPELLAGFCRQRFDYCDVWQQILWKAMSLLKILGTVIRQPDLALGILPDHNLEREVDSAAGRRQHQWRAFGLPTINSLVGGIFIPTFSASPLWSTTA